MSSEIKEQRSPLVRGELNVVRRISECDLRRTEKTQPHDVCDHSWEALTPYPRAW
jgi:hypothetical protein